MSITCHEIVAFPVAVTMVLPLLFSLRQPGYASEFVSLKGKIAYHVLFVFLCSNLFVIYRPIAYGGHLFPSIEIIVGWDQNAFINAFHY